MGIMRGLSRHIQRSPYQQPAFLNVFSARYAEKSGGRILTIVVSCAIVLHMSMAIARFKAITVMNGALHPFSAYGIALALRPPVLIRLPPAAE
jgi:hypothetical protein